MSKVMAINAGSSSLKFKLFSMPSEEVICSGLAERIGHDDAIFNLKYNGEKKVTVLPLKDHSAAVKMLLDSLMEEKIISSFDEIKATGHRVVNGGQEYPNSVQFDEEVEKAIEKMIPLSPLHNPANLVGYRAFKSILPNVPAVAVFDTAFHQTMADEDSIYPIPYEYTKKYGIRRYGAHGTSHQYLSEEGMKYLQGKEHTKVITCHIGSGASIAAIYDGKCVATSMGLTPLGGIMMGTRTGDMDPSVLKFCCTFENKSVDEMYDIFNKKSGLLGVSGVSNDSRDIMAAIEKGDERAALCYKLFIRRIADFIGQYFVRIGGADLIIFSAGIGENSPETRTMVCEAIGEALGIKIDESINATLRGKEAVISTPDSKVKVVVIPTDEEVMIARDAFNIVLK